MGMNDKIRELKNDESLSARCIRGGGTMAAGSIVENGLRFIRNMILARLLVPDAFGLMAIVMTVVAVAEAFSEIGLRQSVVQNKKGGEDEFLNVIFWFSLIRGAVLLGMAWILTPWICTFFNRPDAVQVLRMGFLVLLFNALVSPRVHVLEKELKFWDWILLMQGTAVIGIFISVALAFIIGNIWALVWGYLTESFLKVLISFSLYPFRPRLKFNRAYSREITAFSRRIFGLPILMMLFVRIDTFVIGRVLSLEVLGMYRLAQDLPDIPNKVFSRVSQVVLPAFSLIQDDITKLRQAIISLTKGFATLGIPFFAFLILFSEPILSVVYDPRYSVMSIPLKICCLYMFIYMATVLNMNIYMALGEPQFHRIAAIARTGLFLIIIYPATKTFGVVGASLSALVAITVSWMIQMIYLRKLMDLDMAEYLSCFIQGIVLSLLIIIPGAFFKFFIDLKPILMVFAGGTLCLIAWIIGFKRMGIYRRQFAV